MKHLVLFENFDDYERSQNSIPKEELKNIVRSKLYDKDNNIPLKKKVDIRGEEGREFREFYGTENDNMNPMSDSKISNKYITEQKLKEALPALKKFKKTEGSETKNHFSTTYNFEEKNDFGDFGVDVTISWNKDERYNKNYLLSTNFRIVRTEKIDMNDPSFRVMNQDLIDLIEADFNMSSETKNFNKEEMLEILFDVKDGKKITSYEDNEIVHRFNIFKKYEKLEDIILELKKEFKMFNEYCEVVFDKTIL